ncbi:hypothetical protein F4778DRAFT_786073 [Xylariomycetidae sp. FL2044]|nr:hypothetical protein F4778DRAFT_786073 [Xylariomycetidae sp. FL2044]
MRRSFAKNAGRPGVSVGWSVITWIVLSFKSRYKACKPTVPLRCTLYAVRCTLYAVRQYLPATFALPFERAPSSSLTLTLTLKPEPPGLSLTLSVLSLINLLHSLLVV